MTQIGVGDLHFRDRMLTQAARVLEEAGRGDSARTLRRYLQPNLTDLRAQAACGVRTQFLLPTAGYQIAQRLQLIPAGFRWERDVMGIVSDQTMRLLGQCLIDVDLPFDGHDRALSEHAPRYLVIEVDALAKKFGWRHALTLRDPAATAELATMIQKAHAAGIVTVLIRPAQPHRFPLLSRVADNFDHILNHPAELSSLRAT